MLLLMILLLLLAWGKMGGRGQDKLEVGDGLGMGAEYHENCELELELCLILGL